MQQNAATSADITIAINVIILAYVLYRQAIVRPVRTDKNFISALLVVVGAIDFINFLSSHHVSNSGLAIVFFGLIVLAIGFGAVRACTVRLWRGKDGIVYRQGTRVTIALWLVSIALHTLIDSFSGTNGTSLYLYFGITLTTQRLVVNYRANKITG